MPNYLPNLLGLITSSVWAIRPEMLAAITSVAEREDVSRHAIAAAAHWSEDKQREAARAYETGIPLRAVGSYQAEHVRESSNLYRRGSVAVLPITGAITRYSSLFQAMSGTGASVETMAKDLRLALDDPSFSSVLLSVDSPGGEVNGIAEFARMIFEGSTEKPVWAYVSDLGASAAYWLAAASERIIVAPTAALGSIGCIAVFREEGSKDISFVSSVSPKKRMDPKTKEGASQVQALVDKYGQIFVEHVAEYRSTSTEDVVSDFGGGGLLVGADAVQAGLADDLGSLEAVLADMASLGALDDSEAPAALHASSPPARVGATTIVAADLECLEAHPMTDEKVPETTVPMLGPDPVQARLAALEAENSRLKLQNHRIAGSSWADRCIAEGKAFPSERGHLEATYVQAALDDSQLGPGLDGHLRVQLLANSVASRTSVSMLTVEALAPSTLHAIQQRVQAASADPNAAMTDEKRLRLLESSHLGKQALANQK